MYAKICVYVLLIGFAINILFPFITRHSDDSIIISVANTELELFIDFNANAVTLLIST